MPLPESNGSADLSWHPRLLRTNSERAEGLQCGRSYLFATSATLKHRRHADMLPKEIHTAACSKGAHGPLIFLSIAA